MKNAQKTVSEHFMKNVDHRTIVYHEKGQKQYESTSRKRSTTQNIESREKIKTVSKDFMEMSTTK